VRPARAGSPRPSDTVDIVPGLGDVVVDTLRYTADIDTPRRDVGRHEDRNFPSLNPSSGFSPGTVSGRVDAADAIPVLSMAPADACRPRVLSWRRTRTLCICSASTREEQVDFGTLRRVIEVLDDRLPAGLRRSPTWTFVDRAGFCSQSLDIGRDVAEKSMVWRGDGCGDDLADVVE